MSSAAAHFGRTQVRKGGQRFFDIQCDSASDDRSEAQEALQGDGIAGNMARFPPADMYARAPTNVRRLSTCISRSMTNFRCSPPLRGRTSALFPSRPQAGTNHSQQLLVVGRLLEKRDGARFEGTFFS